MDIRKGVLLIIKNNEDKYLLLQHAKDKKWGFVSGGIESGEDELTALLRESYEELGLEFENNQLQKLPIIMKYKTPNYEGEYVWYFYFWTDDKPIILRNKDEISNYGWFLKLEVIERVNDKPLLVESFKKFLKVA